MMVKFMWYSTRGNLKLNYFGQCLVYSLKEPRRAKKTSAKNMLYLSIIIVVRFRCFRLMRFLRGIVYIWTRAVKVGRGVLIAFFGAVSLLSPQKSSE